MNIKIIEPSVLLVIRGRGLSDEQIKGMSADELFDEFCNSLGLTDKFGVDDYGATLRFAMSNLERAEKHQTPVCSNCGTTENLSEHGWHGYRCTSPDCVPY